MIATILLLVGLVGALVLSGFCSGSETGVYCLNHVRLRVSAGRGDSRARRLERLMARPENLVITMLLGTNVADYLTTACTASLILRAAISESQVEIYATAIATPLILIFGGMVPKDWFRREANPLLMRLSVPILVSLRVAQATGLVWFLRTLTRGLVRLIDPRAADAEGELLPRRARTLHLLREGAARGGLTAVQRDLMERVLRLSDKRCADVMVPRHRAAIAAVTLPRDDFLRIARMAHFSRIPVHGGDPRRIVGIVNVYDVLTDAAARPIAEHARPPLALPGHTRVSTALLRLQRERETMAIAVDAGGACIGLLTVKDLVEEIVGDLEVW